MTSLPAWTLIAEQTVSPELFVVVGVAVIVILLAVLWIAYCITKIAFSVNKGFNQVIIGLESLDTRLANLERKQKG